MRACCDISNARDCLMFQRGWSAINILSLGAKASGENAHVLDQDPRFLFN